MKNLVNNKSAVVLIEFQNQWTESGLYHTLIKGQLHARGVIDNARRLVRKSREHGIRIIHAPLVIDPRNKRGWFAHLTLGKVFTRGSRKAQITTGLHENGDLVVEGRYAFDAFVGSNLEELLLSSQADTLYLAGFTTDQCVAKTLRTAIRKGFEGHLISDCTATLNGMLQRKTEHEFRQQVVTSAEILDLVN